MSSSALRAFQLAVAFPYFPLEFELVSAFFTFILIDRHCCLPLSPQDVSVLAADRDSPHLLLMFRY